MSEAYECISHGIWNFCSNWNCFISWIHDWQTLLTGIGATLAGGFSVYYLRKQIVATEIQEVTRRARRFTAARARLPIMLSDTITYANEAILLLKKYLDAVNSAPEAVAALAIEPRPTLPEQALLSFETIVETTDDDKFAGVIADMISKIQVLSSRLNGLASEPQSRHSSNLQAYMVDAGMAYGFAASIFDFARREMDTPPHSLNWDMAFAGLRLNGLYEHQYSELFEFMDRVRDRHQAEQVNA